MAAAFDVIEKVLHRVIAEYETERPCFSDDGRQALAALPALDALLARYSDDETKFRAGFMPVSEALDRARRAIRADLLGRAPP